jgi:hypothetical protein
MSIFSRFTSTNMSNSCNQAKVFSLVNIIAVLFLKEWIKKTHFNIVSHQRTYLAGLEGQGHCIALIKSDGELLRGHYVNNHKEHYQTVKNPTRQLCDIGELQPKALIIKQ